MKAELLLSRPGYQAGKPVVGTIRIHHDDLIPFTNSAQNDSADGNSNSRPQQGTKPPIREMIVSARLYLAGRAHLGSSSRDKSSRWRSTQEINQLKNIYGDHHPCMSVAMAEEQSRWSEWNDGLENVPEDVPNNDVETFGNATKPPRITSFIQTIQPPRVPYIEQAERLSVHSYLHHSVPTFSESIDKSTGGNQPSNDFSHLPTSHENNVICVWMTNVSELLDLNERHLDRRCLCTKKNGCHCQLRPGRGKFYGDMHPYRPLQLPDMNVVNDVWQDIENNMSNEQNLSLTADEPNSSSVMSSCNVHNDREEELNRRIHENSTLRSRFDSANMKTASSKLQPAWRRIVDSVNPPPDLSTPSITPLEEYQLAFSFRANLPQDIPPTMSAECVKYFYSAVLVVTTVEGKSPFIVLKSDSRHYSDQEQIQPASTTRVQIGNLCAIAHSTALPTYITSTEASSASSSQLTMNENPPACDVVSRRTAEERTSTHRIEDENGGLCAMMTLIGFGGPLSLGTRLGVYVRFPCSYDDTFVGKRVIACHRVCCALVGEEYAVHEVSGGDNPQRRKIRVKTRHYVFDSAYEMVEFGYTEAISMGLVLPLNCPVTVKTDLVEVTVVFKVEFTVSRTAGLSSVAGEYASNRVDYRVIQLDLPCEVVNCSGESGNYFRDDSDEGVQTTSTGMQKNWKSHNERHTEGVDDIDIHAELNVLSTRMLGSYLNRNVE